MAQEEKKAKKIPETVFRLLRDEDTSKTKLMIFDDF